MDNSNTLAAGSLDPDFGNDGIFTLSRTTYGGLTINRLALDNSGAIMAAVTLADPENVTNFYGVVRLLANGTADPDFGIAGLVKGQFAGGMASFGAVPAITYDNKTLLSGYFLPGDFYPRKPALARHLGSGELDTDFGEQGQVVFDIPPPKTSPASAVPPAGGPPDVFPEFFGFKITPLPDGKIIFSGVVDEERDNPLSRYSVLGRLNADGSLDESFADRGYVYPKPPRNVLDQHIVLADGKILIAGQKEDVPGHLGYVARYLPDGELDNEFGANGYMILGGLEGGHITALAAYGDTALIVGANKYLAPGWSGVLMGVTTDGQWYSGFNDGKPVDVRLGTSGFKLVLKDLVVDDSGIVLLGDMGNIALARYLHDGTPDAGYGSDSGWWQYSGRESYDLIRQPDAKIVASGMLSSGEKFVARYMG
jgi:uncharacterized delta-60 repeat protein